MLAIQDDSRQSICRAYAKKQKWGVWGLTEPISGRNAGLHVGPRVKERTVQGGGEERAVHFHLVWKNANGTFHLGNFTRI